MYLLLGLILDQICMAEKSKTKHLVITELNFHGWSFRSLPFPSPGGTPLQLPAPDTELEVLNISGIIHTAPLIDTIWSVFVCICLNFQLSPQGASEQNWGTGSNSLMRLVQHIRELAADSFYGFLLLPNGSLGTLLIEREALTMTISLITKTMTGDKAKFKTDGSCCSSNTLEVEEFWTKITSSLFSKCSKCLGIASVWHFLALFWPSLSSLPQSVFGRYLFWSPHLLLIYRSALLPRLVEEVTFKTYQSQTQERKFCQIEKWK